MLKMLKMAYGVYSGTREAVYAVTKPAAWLRDKLKSAVLDVFLKIALATAGSAITAAASTTVAATRRRVQFKVPVPGSVQDSFDTDPGALTILHDLANDALATPLALAGYTFGHLQLQWDTDTKTVLATLDLGLSNTAHKQQ